MVLFDFEAPGLADSWQIVRQGHADRTTCPVGSCLHVASEAGTRMVTTDVPVDWSTLGAIDFRGWAESETTVEVVLSDVDGRGGWRHKLDIPSDACLEVHLDLGWFRRADGPVVPWNGVCKLALVFDSEGEVWLDEIEVDDGTPTLAPEEIARVTGGMVTTGRTAVVITDVADLDAEALVKDINANEVEEGGALPDGAGLIRGIGRGAVYLIDGSEPDLVKRHVAGPTIMNLYKFDATKVRDIPPAAVDAIKSGLAIPDRG